MPAHCALLRVCTMVQASLNYVLVCLWGNFYCNNQIMTLLYVVYQLPLSHFCSFKTKSCMSAHCAFGELQLIAKLNYVLVSSFFVTPIKNQCLWTTLSTLHSVHCHPCNFRTKLHVTAQCAFGTAEWALCFWTIFEFVSGRSYWNLPKT